MAPCGLAFAPLACVCKTYDSIFGAPCYHWGHGAAAACLIPDQRKKFIKRKEKSGRKQRGEDEGAEQGEKGARGEGREWMIRSRAGLGLPLTPGKRFFGSLALALVVLPFSC